MIGTRVGALACALLLFAAESAGAATPEATAANEAGVSLFRAGTFRAAIEKFEQALAADPTFDVAQRNLAAAFARLGEEEQRSGDLDDARSHFERAVSLSPGEPALHLLLGALYSRRGDQYEARQSVDRALALAPDLVPARDLSGDLFYQEGSLERARGEWERALAGAGAQSGGLRAKIDRVTRELGAENGFKRDVSRHFTIEFDGPVPRAVAQTALSLLERAYDRLWHDFGRAPQYDVPVILYTRDLFDQITRSPAWVGATFDGKIRVPVGGLQTADDAQRLAPVLAHELTHAFIRANVPGRLPLWFEEGLAEYLEGTPPESAQRARRAAAGRFSSLDAVSAALRSGANVNAAYAAAGLAVEEMVRINGFWLVSRTLDQIAAGRSLPDAFRDVSGLDLAEFEERWLRAQR